LHCRRASNDSSAVLAEVANTVLTIALYIWCCSLRCSARPRKNLGRSARLGEVLAALGGVWFTTAPEQSFA
jgi:hypothetical protein